jgi:hypothetical protein
MSTEICYIHRNKLPRFNILRILSIRLTIILVIYLAACSNRHPAYSEYDYAIPMIVRPADSLLAGEYELNEFSYSRVDETQAYHNTPIMLTIRANSSIQVKNLPDMVLNTIGKPVKNSFLMQ